MLPARSVPYYLGIMELAMLLGTKVAIYAQGIGLCKQMEPFLGKKSFLRANWVSVRDEASAHFLAEMG